MFKNYVHTEIKYNLTYDFSERRTYRISTHNYSCRDSIIFVTKVKKTPDGKDKIIIYDHLTYDEDYKPKVVRYEEKLSEMKLIKATPRITCTDFFTMHLTYENWKKRDKQFAMELAVKIANSILNQDIEKIGKGKFEKFDIERIQRLILDLQEIDERKADHLFQFLLTDMDCYYD